MSKLSIKVTDVVCGWSHTSCIVAVGKLNSNLRTGLAKHVFSWGNNDHGKLGIGSKEKKHSPTVVSYLFGRNLKKLASYNEHTLALCFPQLEENLFGSLSSKMLQDFRSLRTNPTFSDVVFVVNGKKHFCHKCVLSARSHHFQALFNKDNNFIESEQNEIVIETSPLGPVVSNRVFDLLLDYIYTDTLCDAKIIQDQEYVQLFVLADFYNLPHLKTICQNEISNLVTNKNVCLLLQTAHNISAIAVKEQLIEFLLPNFEVIAKSVEISHLDKNVIVEILRLL